MVLNFCHWSLQPRISCDKVARDNHEVENLVSPDLDKRRRGFIAEYFIKPPVSITIHFPINIEIQCIVLDPTVGQQKSNGFDIFSCSKKITNSWLGTEDKSFVEDTEKNLFFYPVGKYISSTPNLICFQSVQFHERAQFDMSMLSGPSSYPVTSTLRHHHHQTLGCASHVTIRITRTVGGSAVALKSVQIWGQPAVSCPRFLQQQVVISYTYAHNKSLEQVAVSERKTSEIKSMSGDVIKKIMMNDVEIPEEFIDPITLEIMSIPMLLPSGKIVDQSTLEKFVNTEASWGRCASDLFTGILFDHGHRPVPNGPLKTRIDQFLISNSDRLKYVPRIVGVHVDKVRGESTVSASKLITNPMDSNHSLHTSSSSSSASDISQPGTSFSQNRNSRKRNSNSDQCFVNKRTKHGKNVDTVGTHSEKWNDTSKTADFREQMTSKCLGPDNADVHGSVTEDRSSSNHQDRLSQSLNSALSSTLCNFPSFTNFLHNKDSTEPDRSSEENACVICCKSFEDGLCYTFPCKHLVCRKCVTTVTANRTITCILCQTQFTTNEIVRVFNN